MARENGPNPRLRVLSEAMQSAAIEAMRNRSGVWVHVHELVHSPNLGTTQS